MNLLRKFYNTEVADGGGNDVVDVAALMAKSGYNSDNRPERTNEQVEDKGKNEQANETKVEPQAATASVETKVESAVQEAETPKEVAKVEAQPQVVEQPQTTISWQEVLKQQQPDTVLKELLGVDDSKLSFIKEVGELPAEMLRLIETWKNKGDVTSYVREWTTDYSKMSSEDVMRNQLRNDYPEASDRAIEALFKKKVVETYNLDSEKYSEEEVDEGRLLLDAEADRYRKVLIAKQKDYVLPTPPEAKQPEPDNSDAENLAKFETYKAEVSNNQYIKDIFTNKQLAIGEGEERFNFPIDPNKITDVLFDSDKWAATMFDKGIDAKGNQVLIPRTQHQALVAAVATYGMDFLNEYAKHFKAIGGKSVIDPLDNAKPVGQVQATTSDEKPANAAAAMAKYGHIR